MALDSARHVSIDRAGNQEQQEDQRDHRLHQRSCERTELPVRCAQRGIRRQHSQEQRQHSQRHGCETGPDTGSFLAGKRLLLDAVGALAIQGRPFEPRFDHAVRQDPPDDDHECTRHARKQPVAQGVDLPARIEDLRGRLSETLEQRIDSRRNEIRAEAARDPRECTGNASERMASGSVKDDASQRNDQHVADIRRSVADDGDQEQHGGQQAPRSHRYKALQACADESGVLGNPDAQQRHQDYAQGGEAGEDGHHARQERR